MSQMPMRRPWRIFAAAVLAVAAVAITSPRSALAQEVVVLVDGDPITTIDIAQRSKFIQMSTNKAPSRQEVINGLIDEVLEIKEAHRFGIDVPDTEVNNAFANVGNRMGADPKKLTEILEKGGASAATLKHRLRAQLAWDALVRGRYKASLEIADSDVEAALDLHKSQDQSQVGFEYVLRPIVLVVPRGSPDAAFEARKRDADALRARFQNCAEGIPFARALHEVAVRDQVMKYSADLPQPLRDLLDKTEIGHLTPPEQTAEGVQMFALCARRETKGDSPDKKQVRDQIFQQRFTKESNRYLAELRREAMIEYKQK